MASKIAARQGENRSTGEFSQRTDKLAKTLGVALRALPDHIGISERMLFAYRGGANRITPKAWNKLRSAEIAAGIEIAVADEPPCTYDVSVGDRGRAVLPEVKINPRFDKKEPTPEMCRVHFSEYLRRAEAVPGGIGYVWIKLQRQFPIEEFPELVPTNSEQDSQ